MEVTALLLIALFLLSFGLISKRIQQTVLTAPMIFVFFGLLLSPAGFNLVEIDIENEAINLLAELTLVLVLFTDASRINLSLLRKDHNIPVRLLSLGLPLTIMLGAAIALLFFNNLNIWEALVLAVVLAPTDAALGQAVVSSPKVPVRIRQALNVESGLNDGIGLPFLLFFLSLAGASDGEGGSTAYWLQFAVLQLTLGPLAGIFVGYLGGRLITWSQNYDWVSESFQRLFALAISILAFALAESVSGNGFIAAFCAGMILGNYFPKICSHLYEFAEAEGQLLTLLTFMLFGAVMILPAFAIISWPVVLYAILSLTIIRMLPVAISLLGLKLQKQSLLFLGWFGPRGIASILYCLLILDASKMAPNDLIYSIIMITVFISVIVHGITAVPAANRYGVQTESMKHLTGVPELESVPEMPLRSDM